MEKKKVGKIYWQSKTLWVNVLSAVLIGITAVLESREAISLPEGVFEALGGLLAVINIGLRLVTSQPIKR